MPTQPISSILLNLRDALTEFHVDAEVSVDIGSNALIQMLDAIYYANQETLMQDYPDSLAFRQAVLEAGDTDKSEDCVRSQLGMPPVSSMIDNDDLIDCLSNILVDLITEVVSLQDELGYQGVGGQQCRRMTSILERARRALLPLGHPSDEPPINPTRFEREPVL